MFYPIRIPPTPGFGFTGGPEFQTNVQNIASGREKRNAEWSICRHKYTAPFHNVPEDAYRSIKAVFLIMRGKTHTFLHRDWGDFTAVNETFGIGDGVTTVFQLSKMSSVLGFPAATYTRVVTKPNVSAPLDIPLVIKADGSVVSPSVSELDGSVAFGSPPASGAVLTWSGEFDVQVRFDIDYLPYSLDDRNPGGYVTNGSVDLIEVLDE